MQIKLDAVFGSVRLLNDMRAGQDQVFRRHKPYPGGYPVSGENTDQTFVQLMGHGSPPRATVNFPDYKGKRKNLWALDRLSSLVQPGATAIEFIHRVEKIDNFTPPHIWA